VADTKPDCQEIELKLSGTAASLASAFRSLAGDRPHARRLVSTYYDTGDARLWRKGFTLRLRRLDQGCELTLKQETRDPLARGEWTSRVSGPPVDLALLPATAPRGEIGTILPGEFRECVVTDIRRAARRLEIDGAAVEVALDIGRICAGARAIDVAELEFELIDGPVAAMLGLVRALTRRRRLTLDARSKAERGMALAQAGTPAPARAARAKLKRSDTAAAALARILKVSAAQVVGNLAAAQDGRDPEGVHQFRVALRRLRSALALFPGRLSPAARALDGEAGRALAILGPARDLDVFITETLPPVMAAWPLHEGLARLAKRAEQRREEAYGAVRDLVGDPRLTRFLLDLMIAAEDATPLVGAGGRRMGQLAGMLLGKRHAKVLGAGRDFTRLGHRERHRVRVGVKKLRYACDFFRTLYPGRAARAYLDRLSRLQDQLGHLNDATMIGEITRELAGDDEQANLAAALATGWYGHRLQAEEPRMIAAWQRFAGERPFWNR
jgi:inorganic triphosphatase YgiF